MNWNPLKKMVAALKGEKRLTNLILAAGLVGMLLLAVSEWLPSDSPGPQTAESVTTPAQEAEAYALDLETRLADLIQQVEGAGETRVMVTMAASARTMYATDSQTEADGSARTQHLLLDDGSTPPALVESTQAPEIQGVAVLCAGAGNVAVQSRVTQIVQVLTGVGANRISVECLTQK